MAVDGSPDGNADYLVSYDSSVGSHKKILINNLPVSGGSITFFEANSNVTSIMSNISYITVKEMSITPGAGTYYVLFSADVIARKNNKLVSIIMRNNGIDVTNTERCYSFGITNSHYTMNTQSIETVSNGQTIDIQAKIYDNKNTISFNSKKFNIVKIIIMLTDFEKYEILL